MSYVVFKVRDEQEWYWSGEFRESGRPCRVADINRAISFKTAREAYDHCAVYRTIQSWRVGKREKVDSVTE